MKEPLAFRMRPHSLSEVVAQEHLIGKGKVLSKCIENEQLFSMIFYGNPGCGKTTLAIVLADSLKLPYRLFNSVTGNKKDLMTIFEEAKFYPGMVVIIDEVHRLNKDKQDLLLPHLENGLITLIGCTTANPLFAINPAIRSRTHLFEIKAANDADVISVLKRALISDKGLNNQVSITPDALALIAAKSGGDIRYALNVLEICALSADSLIDTDLVQQYSQFTNIGGDSDGDAHYNTISAFQKSIRGSDVDAALYYLSILIKSGDMDSIERRLLTTAYEDIGLGNPNACMRTLAAVDTAKRIGFPEARIPLANAVIDLCLSPKSKSAINAIDAASAISNNHAYAIPDYLHYTPVNLDEKDRYDYSRLDLVAKIQYLPNQIKNQQFYHPALNSQYERALATNLEKLKQTPRSANLASLKKEKLSK